MKRYTIYALFFLTFCISTLGASCKTVNEENTQINQETTLSTNTNTETADWLTYSDPKNQYTIQYPQGWEIPTGEENSTEPEGEFFEVQVLDHDALPAVSPQGDAALGVFTQEEYEAERDRIALSDSVNEKDIHSRYIILFDTSMYPVITLENGYRAVELVGTTITSKIEKAYIVYNNDQQFTVYTYVPQAIVDKYSLTPDTIFASGKIKETAPKELQEYFATFDEIVNTISINTITDDITHTDVTVDGLKTFDSGDPAYFTIQYPEKYSFSYVSGGQHIENVDLLDAMTLYIAPVGSTDVNINGTKVSSNYISITAYKDADMLSDVVTWAKTNVGITDFTVDGVEGTDYETMEINGYNAVQYNYEQTIGNAVLQHEVYIIQGGSTGERFLFDATYTADTSAIKEDLAVVVKSFKDTWQNQ